MPTKHLSILSANLLVGLFAGLFLFTQPTQATTQDDIASKNLQIQELERQIAEYQTQIDQRQGAAKSLSNEIGILNARINSVQLEIRSLALSIGKTNDEIFTTQQSIAIAEEKILMRKGALANALRLLNHLEQDNLVEVVLKNNSLSDFFNQVNDLTSTQDNLRINIDEIKSLKTDLETEQDKLEDQRSELENLKSIQEIQRRSAEQTKNNKNNLLKVTKGEESKFQNLVKQSKADIEKIRAQIYYLQQNGVTAEDAVKFGELAAIRAGIRPAYLIAVLEIESGLGRNVGRCNRPEDPPEKNWRKIMHVRDHQPFLDITAQLGLNPDTTAVSCPQFVNGKRNGWGGAMGPAQFIPSTWIAYRDQVARITGHNPANPWNIEDAFTASATKLANAGAGAKTRAAEVAASKAYYSGNSRCATASCNSYANAIQNKAAQIEQDLWYN